MDDTPNFLEKRHVLKVHQDQISRYGGAEGLRDEKLLESAVNQPRSTFGGTFLYADHFEMAAALAYSLAMNHPFIDGNKRVAYASALLFLGVNGYDSAQVDPEAFYLLMMEVAAGQSTREAIATFLRDQLT